MVGMKRDYCLISGRNNHAAFPNNSAEPVCHTLSDSWLQDLRVVCKAQGPGQLSSYTRPLLCRLSIQPHVFRLPAGMPNGVYRAGVPTDRHAGTEDLAFEAVKRVSEKQVVKLGLSRAVFVWKPCLKCLFHVVWMTVLPVLVDFVLVWLLSPVEAVGMTQGFKTVLHSLRISHLSPKCLGPWMEMTSDLSAQSLVLPLPQNNRALYQVVQHCCFLECRILEWLKNLTSVFYAPRKNRFSLF